MRLIFIYGLPATGKLTVAQELAKLTGYKLFHNHMVVDLLLSSLEFGSAQFVRLREKIWLGVFREASRAQVPGLIFTFNPEKTVRAGFVEQAVATVVNDGGRVDFVELVCPLVELRPVSYTHLDVYKRQGLNGAGKQSRYLNGCTAAG